MADEHKLCALADPDSLAKGRRGGRTAAGPQTPWIRHRIVMRKRALGFETLLVVII